MRSLCPSPADKTQYGNELECGVLHYKSGAQTATLRIIRNRQTTTFYLFSRDLKQRLYSEQRFIQIRERENFRVIFACAIFADR